MVDNNNNNIHPREITNYLIHTQHIPTLQSVAKSTHCE